MNSKTIKLIDSLEGNHEDDALIYLLGRIEYNKIKGKEALDYYGRKFMGEKYKSKRIRKKKDK